MKTLGDFTHPALGGFYIASYCKAVQFDNFFAGAFGEAPAFVCVILANPLSSTAKRTKVFGQAFFKRLVGCGAKPHD